MDWQYWKPDEWGSQEFDASRFPDPKGMIDTLHKMYQCSFYDLGVAKVLFRNKELRPDE